jgi:DNA-binding NarL/FixJ family response regulator
MGVISVMIVDNESARAEKLASAFRLHGDLTVLATATSRERAIKQLSLAPAVVLLNFDALKDRTLSRFLRTVQTKSPSSRVLLAYTALPEDDQLIDAIRTGIRGYVRAGDPPALVAQAIRTVAAGELWAERRILVKTISRHLLLPDSLRSHVPDLQPLTMRERDMLSMVLQGATNREIAEMSSISERTVKTHLYRVFRKLKVKSRAKAIALLSNS